MSQPSWSLLLGQVHGRQQADHRAVRAVDQQLALQAALHDRRAFDRQLDADHHAEHADVADQVALAAAAAVSRWRNISPSRLACCQQVLVLDHLDGGDAGPGGDRIAAERGGVHAGPQAGGDLGRGQQRPAGDAAAERLGQRHHVGRDAEVLVGEPVAGPAAAGLHFVEDQQQLVLVGQFAASPARKPSGGMWTPPSPWIGSIMMAAVSSSISRATASRSPNGA